MENLNKYKFYASNCSSGHGNFLEPLGFSETRNIEEADVIIFGGGADIEPKNYGEKKGSRTYTSESREKLERRDFDFGMKTGKKFFGICRGHQLICTLAGGKLIQDVTNHSGDHSIDTFDGLKLRTNSIHHQMINPYTIKNQNHYRILAWTSKRISKKYLGGNDKTIYLPWDFKEIEAIHFPAINALSVQYHPEMMYGYAENEGAVTWTQNTFMKFFNNNL